MSPYLMFTPFQVHVLYSVFVLFFFVSSAVFEENVEVLS